MKPLDVDQLRRAISAGRIEWRKHVLQRMAERGISQQALLDVLLRGERIRDYPDDQPFASALFLGYTAGWPLHVVAACDEANCRAYIITAYRPSLELFEPDLKTRRKP
jgi:hypothetical protein